MPERFDIAIVGAGILGLAHALAAARRGLRAVVIERQPRATGASIRNFGLVAVTGQERGNAWRRAMLTRDIWDRIAPRAGIPILQRGLTVVARRPEAASALEAFHATEMGEGCELLRGSPARDALPGFSPERLEAVLLSPHERRVESREAIPRLAACLERDFGVAFRREAQVFAVAPPAIETTGGTVRADSAVVCPGDDFLTLFPERLAAYGLTRCQLQMLRVEMPGLQLASPVMSDLSLVRYPGYAALPETAALHAVLQREQPEHLVHGIHLIAVQSADGSLVVGDSHHYGAAPDPFQREDVDRLILDELRATLGLEPSRIIERWTGTYASAAGRHMLIDSPAPRVRIVIVTSGTGASTAFAIGEEVLQELTGIAPREIAA
jgi:FAD dependent oxidoreductase TIGR03364